MVKVIDSEVVQDDDPRLQQRAAGSSGGSSSGAGHRRHGPGPLGQAAAGGAAPAGAAAAPLFNWNSPPFRVLSNAEGGSLMGLPAVAIYGLEIDPVHYCALAAATAFVGVRGFLGVGCLLVILYANRGPSAGGQQPQQPAAGSQTVRLRPRGEGSTGSSSRAGQGQQAGGAGGGLQGSLERFMTQPPPGREYRGHPSARGQQGGSSSGQGSGGGAFSGTGRKLGGS